jgi:hypothetical protein
MDMRGYGTMLNFGINQKNIKMKRAISYITVLTLVSITVLLSCKKDDPAPAVTFSQAALAGTWIINPSEGTEWQEGVGIVTPRAAEPDLLNATLEFVGTQVNIKDSGGVSFGTAAVTVNATDMEITLDGVGTFEVKNFIAGVSMTMNQKEPSVHSDYEENNPGQFLAFQKFWGLTKKP